MRVVRGLAAGLLLVGLLIGVPFILLTAGDLRGLAALVQDPSLIWQPDDGQVVLSLVTVAGWLLWSVALVCVALETVAAWSQWRRRGRWGGSSNQVQFLRWPRLLVRPLVTAFLSLIVLGGGMTPALADASVDSAPSSAAPAQPALSGAPTAAPPTDRSTALAPDPGTPSAPLPEAAEPTSAEPTSEESPPPAVAAATDTPAGAEGASATTGPSTGTRSPAGTGRTEIGTPVEAGATATTGPSTGTRSPAGTGTTETGTPVEAGATATTGLSAGTRSPMEAGTTETRTPVEAGATPETRAPLDAEADVETPSEPGATAELETMPEPGDTAEAGGAAETGRTETSPSPETPGPAPTGPTGAAAGAAAQARSDAVSDWNVALGLKPDQTVLRYVVQPGDSLWSLAQRHLGAGSAWPRLVAANADLIRSAGHIEVGWELVIPLDSTDPDEAWEHVVVAGDSLWSIAAQRLGSGQRWPELVQANLDRISDPNQIEIGWRLRLPDPTPAVSADETPDGTGTEAGDGPGAGEPTDSTAPAPADGPGEDGSEPGQRSGGDDGQTDQTTDSQPPAADTTPSAEADATTSPPTAEPSGPPDLGQTGDAEEDRSKLHDLVEGTATSLGVFLAGGVTLVLRRRREDQLRARPVGQRLPHPGPEATRLETALGQVAATDGLPGDADILDSLDRSEAGQGRLIFISERGVEVTDRWGEEVDAWGDSPSGDLQPGAMVGLGRDERGRLVLIDLEQPGSVTIRGTDPTQRAGVIRALALDLACQRWTDGVEVIVVGDEQASLFDGFEAVEVLADPTLALARLVRVVAERRRHADQGDLAECRRDPDRADAWHPLVCFFTQPLEAASLAELTQLTSGPSLGVTAVIGQDPPLTPELTGRLILTLEPSGHALLEPAGLSVRPPNLNESDGLDDLMATTAQTDTEPAWWTGSDQPEPAGPAGQAGIPPALAEVAPIPPTELGSADGVVFDPTDLASAAAGRVGVPDGAVALTDDEIDPTGRVGETPDPIADATAEAFAGGTAATAVTSAVAPTSPIFVPEPTPEARISPVTEFSTPSLLMLGPIELHGAAGARPNRAERSCLEYCGWLLEHPGSTAQAMTQGLLVAEGTRRSNLSRLRAWLGASPEGQPYLPDAYSGRLALDPAVTSDWSRLQLLIAGGVDRTPTERLRAALELVRGAPLADAAPGQWHWAEELRTDMVSVIRDIGLALADRALASDDLDAARWSIARALAAAQGDELLLVARLRTEHRAGNRREVERLVGWITRQARQLGVDLFPETVALIQQIIEGTPRRPA